MKPQLCFGYFSMCSSQETRFSGASSDGEEQRGYLQELAMCTGEQAWVSGWDVCVLKGMDVLGWPGIPEHKVVCIQGHYKSALVQVCSTQRSYLQGHFHGG